MSDRDPSLLVLLKDKEVQERDRRKLLCSECRQRLHHAQAQAEQLAAYRRHYHDHWQAQFKSGATPQALWCYRQFVERLDAALAQQAHTLTHLSSLLGQAEHELVRQEIRVASIDKLLERRARRSALLQQRSQQRAEDEWAQRAALHAHPSLAAAGS